MKNQQEVISQRNSQLIQIQNDNKNQLFNESFQVQMRQSNARKSSVFEIDKLSNKFKTQKSFFSQYEQNQQTNIRNTLMPNLKTHLNYEDNQSIYSSSSQTSKWTDVQKRNKIPKQLKNFMKKKANEKSSILSRRESIQSISSLQSVNLSDKFFDLFKKKTQVGCAICARQINQNMMFSLSNCTHKYCMDCLNYYVQYKIKMFQQITCPDQKCDILMSQNSQVYRLLTNDFKEKYLKIHRFYSVSRDPTLKLCPKQNCQGIIKIQNNTKRICNICKTKYCHKCYFEVHNGQCNRHQFLFLKNKLNYTQCKKCKMLVQKNQGCNHIKCFCKHEFCYICGKDWKHDHLCQPQQQEQIIQMIHPLFDCIYFEQNFTQKQVNVFKIFFKIFLYFLLALLVLPAFLFVVLVYAILLTCAVFYGTFYDCGRVIIKAFVCLMSPDNCCLFSLAATFVGFFFLPITLICIVIAILQDMWIVSTNFYKKLFIQLARMCFNFIKTIHII